MGLNSTIPMSLSCNFQGEAIKLLKCHFLLSFVGAHKKVITLMIRYF